MLTLSYSRRAYIRDTEHVLTRNELKLKSFETIVLLLSYGKIYIKDEPHNSKEWSMASRSKQIPEPTAA
jgi:hypothetical protein